ncbi:MAG: biotin synthase BioB [Candidatus Poribacteria bacterium]|nr:biotin synthase BioB [Candidatus Poribacteria bacterium]MDE0503237.1 biotin synthase BioB [Candidatus Poribacteria bacterium]
MEHVFYAELAEKSVKREIIPDELCLEILSSPRVELLRLLDAAYQVRQKHYGNEVQLHIINNAQNGGCPEDCHYCTQAKSSTTGIETYPVKAESEILDEAQRAYESGAYRYCMVFAGRGPSNSRIERLAELIKTIKSQFPIQVCLSAGLINREGVDILKEAGLDRLNHNLNTSEKHYPNVCTTHTYSDRMDTLKAAREVGVELCSGLIVGMGENSGDLIEVAKTLRELRVSSIPVNFLLPFEGNVFSAAPDINPDYCLRVICLFRLLNSDAEIRVAAGRELHLRSMEVMALYPANSLFIDGYLNAKGASRSRTLKMIQDAGFTIKADKSLEHLLERETERGESLSILNQDNAMKNLNELRPSFRAGNIPGESDGL